MISRILTAILLALPLACDPAVSDPVQTREAEIPLPGCDYSHLNLIWNDDHTNLPHECVAKLALCIDQQITSGCDIDPKDCYAKVQHCVSWDDVCWKSTGALP